MRPIVVQFVVSPRLDSKASFVSKGLQKFSSAEVVLIAEFLVDYRAILKINPVIIKTALNINIF